MHYFTIILLKISLLLPMQIFAAQNSFLYPLPQITVKDQSGQNLLNPFAGGMMKPQFSTIDLTQNGIQDLFVFDRADGKVMTFINTGKQGKERYVYAPQFIDQFPELSNFTQLVDFNQNGLKDIFTYSPPGKSGIRVYRNISTPENGLAFELVTEQIMYPGSSGNPVNLFVFSSDKPVIEDLNGNGLPDILSFGPLGQTVDYYENVSVEEYNNKDTLAFRHTDGCWGRFEEAASDNEINLGVLYSWCGGRSRKSNMHPGATMTAIDMDGSGDKDLILGDISYDRLKRLVNGRNSHFNGQYPVDTMVDVIDGFPQSHPADIPTMPAAYYEDVTGNNVRDLLIAPYDLGSVQTTNQVWFYENTGEDNQPVFEFRQNDFLQNTMVDLGHHTAPAFFDYTGNGLSDLVISTDADIDGTKGSGNRLVLFINTGNENNPHFRLFDQDYLNTGSLEIERTKPAFGDITGNGSIDMLLGNSDGTLLYFENEAAAGDTVKFKSPVSNFEGIETNSYSAPYLYDYSGNNRPDLFLGGMNGRIHYYEHTGGQGPVFNKVTDSFGRIRTNNTIEEIVYENGEPVDTVARYLNEGAASPVLADITGDGKTELVSGSISRGLLVYKTTDNPEDSFHTIENHFYSYNKSAGNGFNHGRYLAPAFMNDGNDHRPYLFAGNYRGGIFAFGPEKQDPPTLTADPLTSEPENKCFKVYPNPGSGRFFLETNSQLSSETSLRVYDVTGKEVAIRKTIYENGSKHAFHLPDAEQGIYFVKISNTMCRQTIRISVLE